LNLPKEYPSSASLIESENSFGTESFPWPATLTWLYP
jgi:hypothetical protein